jgi:hypothetical protein
MNGEALKRQRLTPSPAEQGDINMSHVSDSVLNSSSEKALSDAVKTDEIIAQANALDDQQENQVSMLLKKVNFTLETAHIFTNNITRSMI